MAAWEGRIAWLYAAACRSVLLKVLGGPQESLMPVFRAPRGEPCHRLDMLQNLQASTHSQGVAGKFSNAEQFLCCRCSRRNGVAANAELTWSTCNRAEILPSPMWTCCCCLL